MKYSNALVAIFVFSFMLLPLAHAAVEHSELPGIEEKAIAYIENVLPLDFTHYQITNRSYELPGLPNATYRDDAVTFTLNSSDSLLFVNCMFRDGVQYTCDLRVQQGSPAYVRDCSNLLEVTRNIIAGHQAQTGVDCSYLLRTLNMVKSTENVTKVTSGNIILTVSSGHLPIPMGLQMVNGTLQIDQSETRNVTSFHWAYTVGSEEQFIFSLGFDNGNLYSLRDERITNNVIISQGEPDFQPEPTVAVPAPVSAPSASNITSSQVEPPQSQPAVFPFAPLAAVSVLGIVVAGVVAVFYYRRRLISKKLASIPINANEATQ